MSKNKHQKRPVFIRHDDPRCGSGNWHPFPPPAAGFYDVRQVMDPDTLMVEYYENRRVYTNGQTGANLRFFMMGSKITKYQPAQGWQFRFRRVKGDHSYRPLAIMYDLTDIENPVRTGVRDVSDQLPVACCHMEAVYLVQSIPDRFPLFRQIHVEYTPEIRQ